MSFRIADVQVLLLASLVFGLFPAAKAQSTDGGQHIVFSSPEGQNMSNAPLPMAQAPEPREAPNLPAGESAPQFSAPPPTLDSMLPMPPQALPLDNAQNQNNLQDPMGLHKQMGVLTPAQIMKVPSAEQIFGLPEKAAEPQKDQKEFQSPATNNLASETTTIIAEPGWAKVWLGEGNTGKTQQSSNTTDKASGFFGKFFDTARNDDVFGRHSAGDSDTLFGSPQGTTQQSPWDSQLTSGGFTPPASATESGFNSFTVPAMPSSAIAPQSPFTTPRVSSLDTLPILPALPSVPGQNEQLKQPATAASWAPKPPPWTQAQTPLGTPVQLNQLH